MTGKARSFAILAVALVATACATVPKGYSICHTKDCGDNVKVVVKDTAAK
jgi:hypothetical protein